MPNLYANLNELKSLLSIEDAEQNNTLMRLLEAASRQIEKTKLAGRYFYMYEGTRYYSGNGSKWWLPDDILSITTLKTDEDGDATFENTLTENTDFYAHPLNEYPKIRLEISPNGSYSGFASGIDRGVEIAGIFGYGNGLSATPYESRTTLASGLTAGATSVSVASGKTLKIGETIRIDSEQIFITDITTNTLTVTRGVNGTTAATHDNAKAVSACLYPGDIVQATLIMAMRAWKRKDSAYQDVVGSPETGQVITSKGIDPDVAELVAPFRRQRYV